MIYKGCYLSGHLGLGLVARLDGQIGLTFLAISAVHA